MNITAKVKSPVNIKEFKNIIAQDLGHSNFDFEAVMPGMMGNPDITVVHLSLKGKRNVSQAKIIFRGKVVFTSWVHSHQTGNSRVVMRQWLTRILMQCGDPLAIEDITDIFPEADIEESYQRLCTAPNSFNYLVAKSSPIRDISTVLQEDGWVISRSVNLGEVTTRLDLRLTVKVPVYEAGIGFSITSSNTETFTVSCTEKLYNILSNESAHIRLIRGEDLWNWTADEIYSHMLEALGLTSGHGVFVNPLKGTGI